MRCSQVQELLSAFHDGELRPEVQRQIEEHLNDCTACTAHVHELRRISLAARRLDDPRLPADLWDELDAQLDKRGESTKAPIPARRKKVIGWSVAAASVAALIVVAAAIGVGRHGEHGHDRSATDIGRYFVQYRKHPDATQRELNAKYKGRQVELREAEHELHFRPVTARTLPGEISLKHVYLLKMPCCLCVQSVYERPDKSLLMLLEHEVEQPQWFGDRPAVKAICHNQEASIVQFDGELAVTWKCKQRFVTIVGVRDLEEVNRFVAYLDDGGEDVDG